ncbi:MAG: hypothetical protein F4X63_00460 [Nitrospira sp. SB0662_bin_26]|nr:hypothetical protein [Nitrospira sp. SB0662_bin_26]
MRIERRDPTLKYPRAIREEKLRLVLDWLLEFQCSSVELLARRLGLTHQSSYKFFRALLDDQIIQQFKSVYTNRARYLMLTKAGVGLLQVAGRDVAHAHTQSSRLNRYAHLLHDLAVQAAVLKRLGHYDEVIWDKHIQIPDQFEKPDALLHSPKHYWVAVEYERWRKEQKRIYLSFMNHARALIKRHYSGVYYLFDREPDLVHYQTLFEAREWPEYHYHRKTGKITPAGTHFQPDAIERLRDCFLFLHEPHTHTRDSL